MTPSIVTITLNPAIDQTITVNDLRLGTVHRAQEVRYNAGGKGVNVASCLADLGAKVTVTGLLGSANTAPFEALFSAKGISDRFVRVTGENRINIKIADIGQDETTDINLPGLRVDASILGKIREILSSLVQPGTLVVLAGSLPEGLADKTHADLVADINGWGGRVVLDTSGDALVAALAQPSGQLPFCIKPNRFELESWAGRPLSNRADLLATAGNLRDRGIGVVVVSLGAEGALFLSAEGARLGRLPEIKALSAVGAGDAMVAGLVAAFQANASLDEAARLSVACAAAKLGRFGPHLPDLETLGALAAQVDLTVL
jgi:1-phosphofructokinase